MTKFITIHVFGYGEAQLITKDFNFKTKIEDIKTVSALVDNIKTKKPTTKKEADHHAITISPESTTFTVIADKDVTSKDSFQVKTSDLDQKKLTAFVDEMTALQAKPVANPE